MDTTAKTRATFGIYAVEVELHASNIANGKSAKGLFDCHHVVIALSGTRAVLHTAARYRH